MAKWTESNTRLDIVEKQKDGCGLAFLIVFVVLDFLGCIGYAYLHYLKPEKAPMGVVYFIVLGFGILLFFALLNQKKYAKTWRLIVDADKNHLVIVKGLSERGFPIGFEQIDRIELIKERKYRHASEGTSSFYIVYSIYLIRKDKSYFWIDSFGSPKEGKKHARTLAAYSNRNRVLSTWMQ